MVNTRGKVSDPMAVMTSFEIHTLLNKLCYKLGRKLTKGEIHKLFTKTFLLKTSLRFAEINEAIRFMKSNQTLYAYCEHIDNYIREHDRENKNWVNLKYERIGDLLKGALPKSSTTAAKG